MKKCLLGVILMTSSLLYSAGFLPKGPGRESLSGALYERYHSPEAVERQFKKLSSIEEYQVVASWLQLKLLRGSEETFNKFLASEQWKVRSPRVTRLIKILSLQEGRDLPLMVYGECFNKVSSDNRVIPGLGNSPIALVSPKRLWQKTSRFY